MRPAWAIVLAGGNGERLRSLTQLRYGDDRPKQFADIDGHGTLLEQTLARVNRLVPRRRTIVVTLRHHAAYFEGTVDGLQHVLVQPANRGTGPAVAWPVTWLARHDPDAVVAVFPSDHHVLDEATLISHIRRLVDACDPDRVTVVGARSQWPETEYGWIERGLPHHNGSADVFRVRSFIEKPTPAAARVCFERRDLWNTMILVARAGVLAQTIRAALPGLGRVIAAAQGPSLTDGIDAGYALLGPADLSREVLQARAAELLVARLPATGWSDWGTPARVLRDLAAARHHGVTSIRAGRHLPVPRLSATIDQSDRGQTEGAGDARSEPRRVDQACEACADAGIEHRARAGQPAPSLSRRER